MHYFTADLHLFHANVIKHANRPFKSVDEMHDKIRENWNNYITSDDKVYILGDLTWGKPDKTVEYLKTLNGQKHLIKGNHDKKLSRALIDQFVFVKDYAEVRIKDDTIPEGHKDIMLFHYAMKVWNKSHHGSWHVYGHSHGTLPDDINSLSIDVGVDVHNFTPVSYNQLREVMKTKTFKPIDHHGSSKR